MRIDRVLVDRVLGGALLAAALSLGAGAASAANICQAATMTCGTTMPAGGYCECTGHGRTESGSVVPSAAPHKAVNSTAGGCGAHPNAPGCN